MENKTNDESGFEDNVIENLSNQNFMESIVLKFSENKNKILLYLAGFGFSYFVYDKYIAPYSMKLASKIFNFSYLEPAEINTKNPLIKYENFYQKTVKNILNQNKTDIEKFTCLNELYSKMSNCKKEQTTQMWILFKVKVFINLFCTIYSSRFSIILNQIQILILEKIRINSNKLKSIDFNTQEEILKEQQALLNDYCLTIYKKIENLIKPICDDVKINFTYTFELFMKLFQALRYKIEEIVINKCSKDFYLKLFNDYKNKVLEKLNNYQIKEYYKSYTLINNESNQNEIKENLERYRTNIEAKIKFYSMLYDVFDSNVFNFALINSFDYDYSIINETIKLNFDDIRNKSLTNDSSVQVAKILSFLLNINDNILNEKKSIYFVTEFNNKNLNEELDKFYRYIFE